MSKKQPIQRTRASKEKLLDQDTPFAIRESFNHLRTNLMYTLKDDEINGCPVYGITSTGEATGKSTVIANLAVSYSKIDKKVLVIDSDMRCPVQHLIFELDKEHVGLSEILSSILPDTDKAIRHTKIENLDLISSGAIPPNPSELLMGNKLSKLIEKYRQCYDVIFIDFPPIDIVTDALVNSTYITGYIFVVRSGRSDTKRVRASIESMERVGAKILGIVLNDASIKGSLGYSYRYRRYGYSYYDTKNKSRSASPVANKAEGAATANNNSTKEN